MAVAARSDVPLPFGASAAFQPTDAMTTDGDAALLRQDVNLGLDHLPPLIGELGCELLVQERETLANPLLPVNNADHRAANRTRKRPCWMCRVSAGGDNRNGDRDERHTTRIDRVWVVPVGRHRPTRGHDQANAGNTARSVNQRAVT